MTSLLLREVNCFWDPLGIGEGAGIQSEPMEHAGLNPMQDPGIFRDFEMFRDRGGRE
jgi:hypothetical protein